MCSSDLEVLRRQLGLARGAGLVVEEVIKGSAAEKAGLRQHDVLVLLDDQMLLLPEQLVALLDASAGSTPPECTLLRGGAKVTIPLGDRPPGAASPAGRTASAAPARATAMPEPAPARPAAAATRQTAAKPSAPVGLRAPASVLALAGQAARGDKPPMPPSAGSASSASSTDPAAGRATTSADDEVLVREDADYRIRISRGRETRLLVVAPDGRIVFNDEIDSPARRGLVPADVQIGRAHV